MDTSTFGADGPAGTAHLGDAFAPAPAGTPSTMGVGEYARALYRHRWLALATWLLVAVPVALYGLLQPKAYEARIRVALNAERAAPVNFTEGARDPVEADARTQQEIIRSREVARRTIVALRLWTYPAFGGTAPAPASAGTRAPLSPADERRADALVPDFVSRIKVIPLPPSNLVDVVFEAPEAGLAATVVDELGRQFVQADLDARVATMQRATKWLEERFREQRAKVDESEVALQSYKEQQDAVSVDGRQNIVVQRLSDLNASLTRAKTDRIAREAVYNQVRAAERDPARLASIPAVAASEEVRTLQIRLAELRRQEAELSQRYGERHPNRSKVMVAIEAVEHDLAAAMAHAAQVVKNEYESALAQERSLTGALDLQKTDALRLNRQDMEYGRLQREAEANRQIFNALSQQLQQTTITSEFKESPIRILDFAEPPASPVRPQRAKFVSLAVALGLFAALLVALGREMLDARVKTPHELSELLGLPFLGLVPKTARAKRGGDEPRFQTASSPFSDAMRRIRATLSLSVPKERPIVLLVTSTGPQEGKTTLAVGLSQCLAASVQRVLIIDTDLRRPAVHKALGREAPRLGLADYLAGQATLDEVLIATDTKNLTAICAGRVPANPSELLGQAGLAELIEAVKPRFDWIVLDSAPVLSVPEVALVGRNTDGIVFVVGAQMVPRQAVTRARQELLHAAVPFAGCILNKVDLTRHAYYYAPYHDESYENYYRAKA